MRTKILKLDESIGGESYTVRADVPLRIDHMFREKLDDFEDAKTTFVKEMVIEPKYTDETIQEVGIDVLDALFMSISKLCNYSIAEVVNALDGSQTTEEIKQLGISIQKQRFNDLQKKVTVR